jgi:hypothetical protein
VLEEILGGDVPVRSVIRAGRGTAAGYPGTTLVRAPDVKS